MCCSRLSLRPWVRSTLLNDQYNLLVELPSAAFSLSATPKFPQLIPMSARVNANNTEHHQQRWKTLDDLVVCYS